MGHLHEDHVHVPIFNGTNLLTTGILAEYPTLDGDTLGPANTSACYSLGVFVQPADGGEIALDTRNNVVTHMYSP